MSSFIENGVYRTNVQFRHMRGERMRVFYLSSLIFALVTLIVLILSVADRTFGLVAVTYVISPEELVAGGAPLEERSADELAELLVANAPRRLLVLVRDNLRSGSISEQDFTRVPLSEAINGTVPEGLEDTLITETDDAQKGQLLALNLSTDRLRQLIDVEVLRTRVNESWQFLYSITNRAAIERRVEDTYPGATVQWRSWLNLSFITGGISTVPAEAGIWPALVGSVLLMIFTALIAFPLGVGAAIYLQEYATRTWYNQIIETNIRNLAGVPSIIYGLLGLSIFVRALETITQGRTILSASMTLALLILPILIVASQEALRAVPWALREASFGLGATRWQTISRQVLPAALPGIMTGTILALSRAIGETAPLVVVGAAGLVTIAPNGPFSRPSALPVLVYNWTAQPDAQFRNIAAAGILVLMALLLTMNAAAIILRNRYSNRY
jgi:phosphate transport system permease protein